MNPVASALEDPPIKMGTTHWEFYPSGSICVDEGQKPTSTRSTI